MDLNLAVPPNLGEWCTNTVADISKAYIQMLVSCDPGGAEFLSLAHQDIKELLKNNTSW